MTTPRGSRETVSAPGTPRSRRRTAAPARRGRRGRARDASAGVGDVLLGCATEVAQHVGRVDRGLLGVVAHRLRGDAHPGVGVGVLEQPERALGSAPDNERDGDVGRPCPADRWRRCAGRTAELGAPPQLGERHVQRRGQPAHEGAPAVGGVGQRPALDRHDGLRRVVGQRASGAVEDPAADGGLADVRVLRVAAARSYDACSPIWTCPSRPSRVPTRLRATSPNTQTRACRGRVARSAAGNRVARGGRGRVTSAAPSRVGAAGPPGVDARPAQPRGRRCSARTSGQGRRPRRAGS